MFPYKMDLTRLVKEMTKRKMPNWMTFILHRMRNVRDILQETYQNAGCACVREQGKPRKRVRAHAGVGDSCFHTVEQVGQEQLLLHKTHHSRVAGLTQRVAAAAKNNKALFANATRKNHGRSPGKGALIHQDGEQSVATHRIILARLEMTKKEAEPGRSRTRNSHFRAPLTIPEGPHAFLKWTFPWARGLADESEGELSLEDGIVSVVKNFDETRCRESEERLLNLRLRWNSSARQTQTRLLPTQ